MGEIIAFCGRKESGKTELAKICEMFGYEKMSFATPLKKLIADLLSISIDEVNKLKNANNRYTFDNLDYTFLSDETNIPTNVFREKMNGKVFNNTRQLLQFIGTDIIRQYNNEWHVNKLREMIDVEKNYVFDDVRFPNEREMIEDMNGTCWFVVRPRIDNVSNHESENTLKWQDFENIIINNNTLEYLKLNWTMFMENGHMNSLVKRRELMFNIYGNKKNIETVKETKIPFSMKDGLFINEYEFTYMADFLEFDKNKINKIEEKDGYVTVEMKDNNVTTIVVNPLMIEDLKKYI